MPLNHTYVMVFKSIQYTHDNVFGTHILLDCCYKYHCKTNNINKFIHISTDEVFGESNITDSVSEKKNETSVLCPTNPYAKQKQALNLWYNHIITHSIFRL